MRFSEERIQALAKSIAKDLRDRGAVGKDISAANLSSLIAQEMIRDLQVEDEIDGEVRDILSRQPHLPPQGTGEYEAVFERTKREVAQRRGWPL